MKFVVWARRSTIRLRAAGRTPLARDTRALTASATAMNAVAMLQGFVAARWLGPAGYGAAVLVMAFPEFVFSFLDARTVQATVRYGSEFEKKGDVGGLLALLRMGFLVDAAVAALALLAVVATSSFAARLLGGGDVPATLVITYAAISLAFRPALATARGVLVIAGRFHRIALIETVTTAVRVAAVIGLLAAGAGPAGVVIGVALGSAASSVAFAWAAAGEIRRRWDGRLLGLPVRVLGPQRKAISRFLVLTNVGRTLMAIARKADTLVVGALAGSSAAGFYHLGRNIASLPGILTGSLGEVTYPELVRAEADRPGGARARAVRLTTTIGVPLGVLTIVGAACLPAVVPLVLGDAYRSAGVIWALLAAGASAQCFGIVLRPLYLSTDRVWQWTVVNAVLVALFIPGFALMVWKTGLLGGVIYSLVIDACSFVVPAWLVLKRGRDRAEIPSMPAPARLAA